MGGCRQIAVLALRLGLPQRAVEILRRGRRKANGSFLVLAPGPFVGSSESAVASFVAGGVLAQAVSAQTKTLPRAICLKVESFMGFKFPC